MTLLDVMSRSVDGRPAEVPHSWPELSRFLRDTVWDNDANKERKRKAAAKQALYAGGGDEIMMAMIANVFKDADVIQLRQEWVSHAKHNNVLRRAINELATVYSAPARRRVGGETTNADRYSTMQHRTRMHEIMQRVNRLGYLHRAVWVYPRVRMNAAGDLEPVIEVVTPDRFDVITHPQDSTLLCAISLDLSLASISGRTMPARLVVSATEYIYVDAQGQFMGDTLSPHAYGMIPGVLYAVDAPVGHLFDSRATDDLESAHLAVWFENILLLKESKSATKTTVISGDVSRTAMGQADDSERQMVMQDGTVATTLDRSMDLRMFRETAREIYETAAANHGIPPSILAHAGTQSADARELVRVPLKELRLSQQVALRDFERALADVQSAVFAPIADVAFVADGWSLEFSDPQTPLGQMEALNLFEKERQLMLTSTTAEVMRRHPDLSRDQAEAVLRAWSSDELWRNRELLRPLQAIAGSLGAAEVGRQQQPNEGAAHADMAAA